MTTSIAMTWEMLASLCIAGTRIAWPDGWAECVKGVPAGTAVAAVDVNPDRTLSIHFEGAHDTPQWKRGTTTPAVRACAWLVYDSGAALRAAWSGVVVNDKDAPFLVLDVEHHPSAVILTAQQVAVILSSYMTAVAQIEKRGHP